MSIAKLIRDDGAIFSISSRGITIGRQSTNDVVLSERVVSRQHARIWFSDGRYWIRDENSSSGTFVNEQRISGQRELRAGDITRIGNNNFRLSVSRQSVAPPSDKKKAQILAMAIVFVIMSVTVMLFSGSSRRRLPGGRIVPTVELPSAIPPTLSPSKYTVQLSKIDDVATLYINDVLTHKARWGKTGVEPTWQDHGHSPGDSGEIDITPYLRLGDNTLRVELLDTACCGVHLDLVVKKDGQIIIQDTFTGNDSRTYVVTVPVLLPTQIPTFPVPSPVITNTPSQNPTQLVPTVINPTSTSTTPNLRLFWDDFENGIKPEWGMSGDGFASANGLLIIRNGRVGTSVIGNNNWHDYAIKFEHFSFVEGYNDTNVQFLMRIQDRDNYMFVNCSISYMDGNCAWYKTVNGQEEVIPGTGFRLYAYGTQHPLVLEAEGDSYRTFVDDKRVLYFTDGTFSNGGFALKVRGILQFDAFEISSLP